MLVIDPENWRSDLFALILRAGSILGAVVYLPSVGMAISAGLYGVVILDTIALATVIALRYLDHLPFRLRVGVFSLICYALGTGLLVWVGSISQIYLFGFSMLTTILLGLRAGCYAAVLSSVTMLVVGLAEATPPDMTTPGGGGAFEWVVITLNFTLMNTLLTVAIGSVLAAIDTALIREVAARNSLDHEHTLLRTLLDALPDVVFTKDKECRFAICNPETLKAVGVERENQMVGKTVFDLFPREIAEPFHADDLDVLAGKALRDREEESIDPQGNPRWFWTIKIPLRDEHSQITGLIGISRDITSRKRVELERNRLLAQLKLQIERMPLGYLLCDANFRYTRWNPAAERMFGYSEPEVLGKHPFDVIVPTESQGLVAGIFDRIRAGHMNAHGECANLTKNRGTITCEWYNTPLFDEDGTFAGLLSLAQDVTDRKKLEEKLRQSQRMEAFGQLAGGVAHDFNNMLTVINGYSELLMLSLPGSDPSRKSVAEIHKAGERSAALTRQLLAFSRQQVLAPQTLDLNAVVTNSETMLRKLIGEDIEFVIRLMPGLWAVRADSGQLEQVLLNLSVNARDAMPTGGRLTIETSNVELDGEFVRTHPGSRLGSHVLATVSDTGCGMPPEVMARMFEPFFTTKDIGKGTGLGLATVFGIVNQSGGHVEVTSEVGVGTTFRVYLPQATVVAREPVERGRQDSPPGSETILLVEDEPALRALSKRVLTACGYTVIEAVDGDEAVRVAEGSDKPIHLLVTDVVMPGVGGQVVAELVTRLHPDVRVLFVSGYTDDAVVKHGVLSEKVNFLQKPFSPVAFAVKVREVLDHPAIRNA